MKGVLVCDGVIEGRKEGRKGKVDFGLGSMKVLRILNIYLPLLRITWLHSISIDFRASIQEDL